MPGIDFKCALARSCSTRDQLQGLVHPYALHPLGYISDPLKFTLRHDLTFQAGLKDVQTGLEFVVILVSVCWVLGLEACTTIGNTNRYAG